MYIDLKIIASNFNQHATSTLYFSDSKLRFEEAIRKSYQEGDSKFRLGDRAPEFNAFSQKNNWKKVHSLSEIPFHHSEGTLFITSNAEMNWQR